MKNILFLAPRLPLPADTGGKIRTVNILKQLAKVHLLCFSFEKEDQEYVAEFKALGIQVTMVAMPASSLIDKVIAVLLSPIPFSIAKYNVPSMRQTINDLLKKQQFEAVHIDHLHMGIYRNCFASTPCFLDEHNVEYRILERCADVETSWIKKWLYKIF